MHVLKRIVCLANSRKLHGRCIAGREYTDGEPGPWVRPISARPNGEVSEYEWQYEDGSDPCVLDIIDVPLLRHQPKDYQQENWLLDPNYYWSKEGYVVRSDLHKLLEPVEPLWVNGYATYHGSHDKVPLQLIAGVSSSLKLIQVDRLNLHVFKPGEAFGNLKRRVHGSFSHGGTDYRLWVTDPIYERRYLAMPDGFYTLGECFLTISLGEPHNDACYKLIAAVIESDEGGAK